MTKNLYSLMYGKVEENDDTERAPPKDSLSQEGKVMRLTIAGKEIVVPSIAYVNSLEKKISDQSYQINKLKGAIAHLRTAINTHVKKINELDQEVSKKVNYRE